MKGSIIIIAFFALGIAVGLQFSTCNLQFSIFNLQFSTFILYALMFCVGISIGSDTKTLKSFKDVNPRLMMLPVMTVVSTLAGTAAASALLPHRHLFDCLAIGSGFGYYSLSSIFITEYKGAELGTIALLANIMREIITLMCAPLLVRYFGKLAPISMGGATTMDTTLPIITRTSGQDYVIVSIFHGFCVDFSVPFLVTFFSSI
ncbi:MAG: lysine exporter LysO family protein [Prevotella sp.]|nr:lysine exporter LysO family protein [Prevotella sp.]